MGSPGSVPVVDAEAVTGRTVRGPGAVLPPVDHVKRPRKVHEYLTGTMARGSEAMHLAVGGWDGSVPRHLAVKSVNRRGRCVQDVAGLPQPLSDPSYQCLHLATPKNILVVLDKMDVRRSQVCLLSVCRRTCGKNG
jgi:hypothetical protein